MTLYNKIELTHLYVVLTICIYRSLLIKYSTFTVFVSFVKILTVLVSSIIISISYAGFQKIIDIIIVNNNVSCPIIDPWGTPRFIGKVYHCTSSSLTDCLQLVAYYCVRCIDVSSIPWLLATSLIHSR